VDGRVVLTLPSPEPAFAQHNYMSIHVTSDKIGQTFCRSARSATEPPARSDACVAQPQAAEPGMVRALEFGFFIGLESGAFLCVLCSQSSCDSPLCPSSSFDGRLGK
jgi:hypothetical protein